MAIKINYTNPLFQSPYTYIQAAGSNGDDGSATGIHLRWDFLRSLGQHFPKGNLSGTDGSYPATEGFNKNNDFVRVYRTSFNDNFKVTVDFIESLPDVISEVYNERYWDYKGFTPIAQNPNHKTDVRLIFTDIIEYDALKEGIDPNSEPLKFLKEYQGVIKIKAINKLKFKGIFNIDLANQKIGDGDAFKVEAVSLIHDSFDETNEVDKYYISCRRSLRYNDKPEQRTFLCENIEYFRFQARNFFLSSITLYTYEDYLVGNNSGEGNDGNYNLIGEFSLDDGIQDDDEQVRNRLEDTSKYTIHKKWPKYNETNQSNGEFCVNVPNYIEKWQDPEGLKNAVISYLNLSMSNPLAIDYIPDDDSENDALIEFSYLDMLKLVSLDYHVARMLGLGCIDVEAEEQSFMYVMEYVTVTAIEDVVPNQTTSHLFMTLPTTLNDSRLPVSPKMEPISYGMFLNNATQVPSQLTDDEGYTPYADERYINLKRETFQYEQLFDQFYATEKEFCICNQSPAVGFGIEYKKDGESAFRKPEINHDSEFTDATNIPETIFVPNSGELLVFNHREIEEGVHDYAFYSINWFSRASQVGNIRQTDYTKFQKRNSILPPYNLAVQLIQEESPLLFTTQKEQDALSNLSTSDKTLVRATFDWNYYHHKAYQLADYAEIFFKELFPLSVKGKVIGISNLPNNRVQVTTGTYQITSITPTETVQPNITSANAIKFIGSAFVSGENTFIVESVSSSGNGDNPTFILAKIRQTNATEFNNDNIFTVTENFVSPNQNDVFLVVENLTDESNWDSKLNKKVYLEPFYVNEKLEIITSSNNANNKLYTIDKVSLQSGNTLIKVLDSIPNDGASTLGKVRFDKKVRVLNSDELTNTFTVEGDVSSELNITDEVTILGAISIDGVYTVSTINVVGSNTEIQVNQSFSATQGEFYLKFVKSLTISNLSSTTKTILVSGDITAEINPPYREPEIMPNGDTRKNIIGGIYEKATVTEFEDKDQSGAIIPGSRTGVYEVVFNNYQLNPHIQENVDWHKGIVRILEDANFLPTPLEPNRTTPEMKNLQIWDLDISGSTLKVTAYDSSIQVDSSYNPIDEYVPILTSSNIDINAHPAYRTYLLKDTAGLNNFDKNKILPQLGDGSKQTFMGIRAMDIKETPNVYSHITTPVILLAQEIVVPLPPYIPTGPSFATRPDYYGKSTYTFDVKIDTTGGRQPHMLVLYRANERSILDKLYKPSTVAQILNSLENLSSEDAVFFTDRWNDLVNVNLDNNGLFKEHPLGGYKFPIPDNDKYSVPEADISTTPDYPFDGITAPGAMKDKVKQAIDGAFLPLTEQPVIYQYIDEGKQTRNTKPKIKDNDGQVILPSDPKFDPSPMAVKFTDGDSYVRFTDYTLDGSARNFYFYYGIELSNQLKISGRSPISGPIKLVNAYPAEEPAIKKAVTQLSNEVLNIPPAILFEVNDYIKSEGIKKIDIYRTSNHSNSLSIRTMDLVKSVDVGVQVLDDFESDLFPLYGDPLFYRIVANREIKNEENETELIPSKPSNVVLTNLVDNVNPPAPIIVSENGLTTAQELQEVILKWKPTCYNGTYRLQKMNDSGNWQQVYEIKSNDTFIQYPPIDIPTGNPDFINFPVTNVLERFDEDDNPIYHRFRVQVENSSGLLNLNDEPIILGTGCFDLQVLTESIIYEDNNGYIINDFGSQEIDDGINNNPGPITLTANIPNHLPAGHNSFDRIDIVITDDLGNKASGVINSPNGSLIFNDGDGDTPTDSLQLNDSNRQYSISSKLFTDFCNEGFRRLMKLEYIHGPCNNISKLDEILKITDSTHTYNLTSGIGISEIDVNDGAEVPGTLTFTDISDVVNMVNPQSFQELIITLSDESGNSETKTIISVGGSVVFNDGDNGLILNDASLNRGYSIFATLKTTECSDGQSFEYYIVYSYNPCEDLQNVTDVVSFTDNSGASIASLANSEINEGVNNPGGSITITDLFSTNVPQDHTITSMDIELSDGNNGYASKPLSSGGVVTFNSGDGEAGSILDLSSSNPNPSLYLTVMITTDLCQIGTNFSYSISYTYTPEEDLASQTGVVSFVDANGLGKNPLDISPFNDGNNNNPGGSITITELISSNLPNGDTFDSVEITIQDGLNGSYTDTINSVNGSVTFSNGQGGLILDSSQPNRTYTFIIKVTSTLVPDGVTFIYTGRYTFGA